MAHDHDHDHSDSSFTTQYFQPMDRDYGVSTPADNQTNDVGVGIGDFGMSLALGPVPNVHAVGAKLRAGSKTLEFVFTGSGKGSGQGQTPEQYGLKQRQALVEMGKVNEIDFTTHATVGIYGMAGMSQQGFSKEYKNSQLDEMKRAVEFAADVSHGGAIVVHTGEFNRPVVDAKWNQKEGDPWKNRFEMYDGEEGRTSFKIVDSRTGGFLEEARKNRKVNRPKWKKYGEGDEMWDEKKGSSYVDDNKQRVRKGDYIDYFGNKVTRATRVPIFDKEGQRFVTELVGWDELEKDAKEMTKEAKEFWKKNKGNSKNKWEESIWARFRDAKSEDEVEVKPEEAYVIASLENQMANTKGYALYYGQNVQEAIDAIKKLRKAKELYEQIEDATSPEEEWRLKRAARQFSEFVPPETEMPTEIIEKQIKQYEHQLKYSQESSASQWAQAENSMEMIKSVESAETYALREAYDAYARAGISAMMHSNKLEKEGKLRKPLTVAMENLFPESFGSHPDEFMKLVEGSRTTMKDLLVKKGMSPEEAKKEAAEHITGTIDVGHLNMWRKYWKGDDKKTMEENEKEFDKWAVDKIGEMAKRGVIGHVHVDDNYGYQDDHLAPGEGNAPIRRMIKALKDNDYKGELIVEPGADYYTDSSGFNSVMKTWRLFGSPVYGATSGVASQGRTWEQVGYGHFGQNQPPYFVFEPYSPSEEWRPWSGVPLE